MSVQSGTEQARQRGIPDSSLPGPFAVGRYAQKLREHLRARPRVQLIGELVNLRVTAKRAYFELRDASGAVPCSAWLSDWERIAGASSQQPAEGVQVVVAGGCDYYTGSASASPAFSFNVTDLRVAGEGDLLAQIDRLRKLLDAEGLLDRQKRLSRRALPTTIGVITGESGKARDDLCAALARRGWSGRIVWAFAPVQDRHAAPAITRALCDLAALGSVDVVIVARGGGALADLLCFCDETLCRTVSLLAVPVLASVGHHTDRTLLDDVAAVSCSTPTHAAEAAVTVDCRRARAEQLAATRRLRHHAAAALEGRAAQAEAARRLRGHAQRALRPRAGQAELAQRLATNGRRAVLSRASRLLLLSRAPAEHLREQRLRLRQQLREMRAGSRRRLGAERGQTQTRAVVLSRKSRSTLHECRERRPRELQRLALALTGHDPQRTLERGYVLAQAKDGGAVTSAEQARREQRLELRFADGAVEAQVRGR